jgi:hypothetical protein
MWRGIIRVESKSSKVVNVLIIEDKVVAYACACKRCSIWSSSQSSKRNYWRCAIIFLCPTNPHKGEKKANTERTITIVVKSSHQRGFMLDGQEEGEKQMCWKTNRMHLYKHD